MSNGLDGLHLTQMPESKKNIIAIKDIEKKKKKKKTPHQLGWVGMKICPFKGYM